MWEGGSGEWGVGSGEWEVPDVQTGRLADFVVPYANPLEDIRNTNSVGYVMKNGPDNSFYKQMLETVKQ